MNIFAFYIRHTLDAFRDTNRIVRHFDLIKLNGISVIFKLFFIRFFYAFSFIRNLSKPKKIKLIKNWILKNNPSVYSKIYKVLAYDINEIINPIKKISCPTLVVTGDQDFGNNPDMSKRICKESPNSKLVIMRNLRHMGLVEDPKQFGKILEDFLNQFLDIKKK